MKDVTANHLLTLNGSFAEELYQQYLDNPLAIDASWRNFFDELKRPLVNQQLPERLETTANVEKQVSVLQLINAYRNRGYQQADIDALGLSNNAPVAELELTFHNLTEKDLDTVFNTGSLVGPYQATLRDILSLLRDTYCRHIGSEYMHIASTDQKRWLQERLEKSRAVPSLSADKRRQVLQRIIAAEGLERYLHTQYVGQKRFSLEGGESLIPVMDELIQNAGAKGVKEIVIGMAHRGRLNVLINVLGKSPGLLFKEFEGKFDPSTNQGSGDVKYHQGFSSDVATPGGPMHLTLAFNPSHLEIINPVVEGSVRARQQRRYDTDGTQVLPLLIHGDAAFAGQGVVMETFNMSQARGFTTGGTVHIIINNQIGFTTSNPADARSTQYCTEVARMVQAPIFHVNGDDPEACVFAMQIALDFRMKFKRDVVVDIVCYRRHGHSEADEPSVTQPIMYHAIRKHPTVANLYAEKLLREGIVGVDEVQSLTQSYREAIRSGTTVVSGILSNIKNEYIIDWAPFKGTAWTHPVTTAVAADIISKLNEQITRVPEGFELHGRVAKILEDRRNMGLGSLPVDWGYAETMAYATILNDGYAIRVTGQDSGRGTFFHRHAVLHDQKTGECYTPLQHLFPQQPHFVVIDSLLSEEAVLGFEYGFATSDPHTLVIWEAQFGDFANNAQVVIDQFISSCEAKWGRLCGLVLFLPHGYDGQGPEHSSARLERYLQLCAEDNIQVCVPSIPAQIFHLLRRQMLRPMRKPLIVLTPKSLLRHRESTSMLDDLITGGFKQVIGEIDSIAHSKVKKVIVCAGKVYFDLMQERRTQQIEDIAIIRIEQLYPFPAYDIKEQLRLFNKAKDVVWCQEEPQNQGAWYYIWEPLSGCLAPHQKLDVVARPASSSPAVGYLVKHLEQQKTIVAQALRTNPSP